MNDDDDSEDFLFDLLKTLVALLVFVMFIVLMGTVIVGLLSWFQ